MNTENDMLAEAIAFAAECHKNQKRKGTNIPYIAHPVEAMAIAATITDDRSILATAVLHDVMEDAGVSYKKLKDKFDKRVAKLVKAESEEKKPDAAGTWKERKEKTIRKLAKAEFDEKLLVLCDKLSNIRAIGRDLETSGAALWERFNNNNKDDHAWYYRSIRDNTREFLNTPAYIEFVDLIYKVFDRKSQIQSR